MKYSPVIPQDVTFIPGMKTIMADSSDSYNVSYTKDIVYAERPEEALTAQLLTREGPDFITGNYPGKNPLLIYVQGSAWLEQNTYNRVPMFADFVRAGYTVASVKYRASTKAKWPAFLQDVKSAIRFFRANAEKYGIDPERIAIWGDSSGGNTAALVAATGDMEEFKTEDNKEYSDAVMCAVDFYGPTDCAKINDGPRNPMWTEDKDKIPEDILFGTCIVDHPEAAQPGNPITYISKDRYLPPMMIAHGDWDEMVPFNQSVILYQRLLECGKVCEFYKVVGAGHGIHLWTKELMGITIKFLDAYMK
ncbi:MAG: alpha/beta hydrolase [Clostridia bacterium]|nr:alpha/beta hydrolase [Clostridia bacterium]